MFLTRRNPHDIARAHFFNRAAIALNPAEAGGDQQGLAQGMRVPIGARAWLEGNAAAGDTRGLRCLKQWIDAHRSSKIFCRRATGRLRTTAFDIH